MPKTNVLLSNLIFKDALNKADASHHLKAEQCALDCTFKDYGYAGYTELNGIRPAIYHLINYYLTHKRQFSFRLTRTQTAPQHSTRYDQAYCPPSLSENRVPKEVPAN